MSQNRTSIVLVIDRSGSMGPIAQATTDALNEFVNGQKAIEGPLTLDAVFFDTDIENRFSMLDPRDTEVDLTVKPRGMTALFDAIGTKVTSFREQVAQMAEAERPENILFVIATDGHENSSTEYGREAVANLIKSAQGDGWKFTFLGANQDAVLTAQGLNIAAEDSITFAANIAGVTNVVRSMGTYASNLRSGVKTGYSIEDRNEAMGE